MREVLFRGKRVDNGEWVYGFYVPVNYAKPLIVTGADIDDYSEIEFDDYYHVNDTTVGQYTGLTDKNGKKIFEGDICSFDNGEPDESERYTNYAVQWDCVNCRYVVVDGYNHEDCLDIFFAKHAEVIGNIHDNPEFLAR